MSKNSKLYFVVAILFFVASGASAGSSFGRDDSSRQRSNSQKGFEDLENEIDREFGDDEVSQTRKREARREPVKKQPPERKPVDKKEAEARPMQKMPSVQDLVVEKSGVKFQLVKCKKNEKALSCKVQLTSRAFDRGIVLYVQNQRFVDNIGNEYKCVSAQIGSVQNTYEVRASLISDITTNAYVNFQNLSSEAENIAVFELKGTVIKDGIGNNFVIQYRKIEFSD